jgi:flagellar hook assembly protein FlgD
VLGKKVKTLIANENKNPGYHTVDWDGTNDQGNHVASGVYIYSIKANSFTKTKKMILIR